MQDYEISGNVAESVSALITLFVGLGVVVLVIILVSVIGAKTYSITQADIKAMDGNSQVINGIEVDLNSAISNSFGALSDTAGFVPLVALAVVMFLVLGLVLGSLGGRTSYGGMM